MKVRFSPESPNALYAVIEVQPVGSTSWIALNDSGPSGALSESITEPFDLADTSLQISVGSNSFSIDFSLDNMSAGDVVTIISGVVPSLALSVTETASRVSLQSPSSGRFSQIQVTGSANDILQFPAISLGKDPLLFVSPGQEYEIEVPDISGTWRVRIFDSSNVEVGSIPLATEGDVPPLVNESIHDSPDSNFVYRGETRTWEWRVGENKTPLDPVRWPSVEIKDPKGVVLFSSVVPYDPTSGVLSWSWSVPESAMISQGDSHYRIRWEFVDSTGQKIEHTEIFDVIDRWAEPEELENQIKRSVLLGERERLWLTLEYPAEVVNVSVYDGDQVAFSENAVPVKKIGRYYVYQTEYQVGTTFVIGHQLSALWSVYREASAPPDRIYQQLMVVTPKWLPMVNTVRMMVDKYRKSKDMIQSYSDAEIVEGLLRGAGWLNTWFPTTTWSLHQWPDAMQSPLAIAAFLWVLNSQYMLEVDLQFSFNSPSVTLDYDRTGLLDSAISRALEWLREYVPAAKEHLIRSSTPAGIVVGRPFASRGFMWKVAQGSASNMPPYSRGMYPTLFGLGLI